MISEVWPPIPRRFASLLATFVALSTATANEEPLTLGIHTEPSAKAFALVGPAAKTAPIVYSANDAKVVEIASKLFAEDVQRVTGQLPEVSADAQLPNTPSVVIGTMGHSKVVDQLIASKQIDPSAIRDQWESFLITTAGPHLVILGSDRRGTAFGVFTLSEAIGVSPLYWWADVPSKPSEQLHITAHNYREGSPSVKYRGLFINDEAMDDASLHGWAKSNFEPDEGRIGPKTYAKVFELLLRLKANYCWPAMHKPSLAFNMNPQNAHVADDYAIVMGTSHCEQMLRNNVAEWKKRGPWNYLKNRDRMYDYWKERVQENKAFENTYTIGLRGVHDTEMVGAKTIDDMVEVTQQAIRDQREILSDNISSAVTEIPQVLCTYKEVQIIYENGLKVPDDVTLLWADDNHGYIRRLSTAEEQQRSGGSGVYYHLSLLGTPDGFLWLSTISPSLMSYELSKAHAYGADRIWMINVGDLKPAEKELTFAMQLAWDIDRWTPEKATGFIAEWAGETFGKAYAQSIGDLMNEFYILAASGKPEHVYRINYTAKEIEHRLNSYRDLDQRASVIYQQLPDNYETAFDHLILYPIQGSRWQNEHMLLGRRSQLKAASGDTAGALADAKASKAATTQLDRITERYNHGNGDGKWKNMMSWWPRPHRVESTVASEQLCAKASTATPPRQLGLSQIELDTNAKMNNGTLQQAEPADTPGKATLRFESNVAGHNALWALTTIPTYSKSSYYGHNRITPSITGSVNGTAFNGKLSIPGNRWHTAISPPVWNKIADIEIQQGNNTITLDLHHPLIQISDLQISMVEPSRVDPLHTVSVGNYTKKGAGKAANIKTLPGLGTGVGVASMPFTAPSLDDRQIDQAPWVEYEIPASENAARLIIRTLPNQRIHEGRGMRYAVSIDDSKPRVFDVHADEFTSEWQTNVIRGFTSRSLALTPAKPHTHRIRIYLLDPGLVLSEILIATEETSTES